MILPTMTFEEVRRELEKDAPIVMRKAYYVSLDLEKKMGKAGLKQGPIQYFDYLSKYKNQWIYRLRFTKKRTEISVMMVYHNGHGHAAVAVSPEDDIVYHTPHFLNRYNERRNLGLTNYKNIIHAFMNENQIYTWEELEEIKEGVFKVFMQIPSGAVLGTLDKNLWFTKANTYLPNEMLNKTQTERQADMKERIEKYLDEAGLMI